MMKRFHLTIPYIIASPHGLLWFFRYYPQLKPVFRYMYPVLCRGVFYPLVFGTTICPVPFAASALLPRRIGYVSLFTLYGLEDEDGKLTQARDLAVLSWIQRCKSRSRITALSCVLSKTELLKIQRKKNIFRSVYMNSFSGSLPFKIRIF